EVVLWRRQLVDRRDEQAGGAKAVDGGGGQGGVSQRHARVGRVGLGHGVVEQRQDRLRGAGGVSLVAGVAGSAGQGEGGAGLVQVVVARHDRIHRGEEAVDEAALHRVHADQPLGPAARAVIDLVAQGGAGGDVGGRLGRRRSHERGGVAGHGRVSRR